MCITSRSSVAISTYSMVTLRTALAMAAHLRTKVSPGTRCLSAWAAATWAFVVAISSLSRCTQMWVHTGVRRGIL
jgi:hypothetical protein